MKWFNKRIKLTGTKYRFNDYPFNSMTRLSADTIEASFNVGNPKMGDVIELGKQKVVIDYFLKTKGPLYIFVVKPID